MRSRFESRESSRLGLEAEPAKGFDLLDVSFDVAKESIEMLE